MRAGDAALARLPGDVTPLVEGDSSSVRVDLRDFEGVTVAISIFSLFPIQRFTAFTAKWLPKAWLPAFSESRDLPKGLVERQSAYRFG